MSYIHAIAAPGHMREEKGYMKHLKIGGQKYSFCPPTILLKSKFSDPIISANPNWMKYKESHPAHHMKLLKSR
jgi:hypothetical protein